MIPFWLVFVNGKSGCVEAKTLAEAMKLGAELSGQEVITADILPYPAEPRLNKASDCPSFCYQPSRCKGRTACPQSYACSE